MGKPERNGEAKPFWPAVKERADLTGYVKSRFKGLIRSHVLEVALERSVDGELWLYTQLRARGGGTKSIRQHNVLAGLEDAPLHRCVKAYVEMDTYDWLMVTDILRKRVAAGIAGLHEALHAGARGDPLPTEEEISLRRRLQIERARKPKHGRKSGLEDWGPGGGLSEHGGQDDDDDEAPPF